MKSLRPALAAALLFSLLPPALAQDASPTPAPAAEPAAEAPKSTPAQTEFKVLFGRITEKLKAGQASEEALADELRDFDALIAKYAANKDDDVAMIAFMKARLYLEVFENLEKASVLLKQLQVDFPDTEIGRGVGDIAARIDKEIAARAALAVGQTFPAFAETGLDGQPLALGDFKGKVVLVDFWATWCGPCVAELPHVLAAYRKYQDKGFAIVGISLDKDRDALTAFINEKEMTWPQYFDGQGWENKLGQQYGISSIPATFLLDREGKIVARDLRGDALEKKLAELLGE